MADENDTSDKTEDPTQKRLDDAHDRGDVAKSQEINTWFVIAGATLVLSTFSGSIGGGILMPLRNLLANSWMIHADGPGLMALAQSLEYALIAALGVPLLMLALAAIARNMVQHPLAWAGAVGRVAEAEVQQDLAGGGSQADLRQAGGGELRQGHFQSGRAGGGDDGDPVAGASSAGIVRAV